MLVKTLIYKCENCYQKFSSVKISRNFLQITFSIAEKKEKRFVIKAIHKFNVFYVVKIMEIINYNAEKSFSI